MAVTDAGRGEVWNISIGDTHEYVANGVLVMNSLRNAAMRGGAALQLWHKGELHIDPPAPEPKGVVAAVVDSLPPLSDGDREFFDTLAHDVAQTFLNLGPMKALERVMMEKLEAEQRIHLEQRLDSKVRAGLKQAGDLKRAEKTRAKA